MSKVCFGIAVSFWLITCLSFNVLAAESRGETAVNKELEKDIGMPILDGDLWQKMTHDDKVAFIWGFWHVVSIERYLMGKYPEFKTDNFSAKVIEGSNKTRLNMNEIVTLVDKYYQSNPNEIEKPVVAVLWDNMVKANIKTGIAGREWRREAIIRRMFSWEPPWGILSTPSSTMPSWDSRNPRILEYPLLQKGEGQ